MTTDCDDLENALAGLPREYGPQFVKDVTAIVRQNARQGRLQKFIDNGTVASAHEYVQRVASEYRRQAHYVRALQTSDDPELWEPFFILLQKWAYGALSRRSFREPAERQDHAESCAADAAIVIRTQPFPFDTEFDAWACMVVTYTCANHVRRARRGPSVRDHNQISLEQTPGLPEILPDQAAENEHKRAGQRHDLLQHVDTLSKAQQQFIMLHYFQELGYDEISTIMGRTTNALYKLNFDALANLRKKMLLSEHNYE